jgi:hypothetical protein
MKTAAAVIAAVLFSLLAISPLPAQDEHRDAAAPAQQEVKPAPEPHAAPQPDAKPPQDTRPSRPEEAKPQGNEPQADREKHAQQDQQKQAEQQQKQAQKNQQKQAEQQQKDQQQQSKQQQQEQKDQAKRAQNENRPATPEQRMQAQNSPPQNAPGPRGGGRIPDDKFRAQFGRDHHFRIGHPTIVEGRPRFEYSGYSFELIDPWPAAWSYDDDCYIDYVDDEYWLFDPLHPGMRIAVVVEM